MRKYLLLAFALLLIGFVSAFLYFKFRPITKIKSVAIIPIELIPIEELAMLKRRFEEKFKFDVQVETVRILPNEAWKPERGQIDAAEVLKRWPSPIDSDRVEILIARNDMFTGGTNFIFSLAAFDGHLILASTARFNSGAQAGIVDSIAVDRLFKTLLRMLGLTFGLWLSNDCAMNYSNSLAELDAKIADYCEDDATRLRTAEILR